MAQSAATRTLQRFIGRRVIDGVARHLYPCVQFLTWFRLRTNQLHRACRDIGSKQDSSCRDLRISRGAWRSAWQSFQRAFAASKHYWKDPDVVFIDKRRRLEGLNEIPASDHLKVVSISRLQCRDCCYDVAT